MRLRKTLAFQMAAAYIGTVIGAGFASGQEIMQFFTIYGTKGIYTLIGSGIIFIIAGYAVFNASLQLNAHNYKDFIYKLCGNKLGFFYDLLITIFLFLGTSIMFSGSGALFEENLKLPSFVGVMFIAVLTLWVVLHSLNGILKVNAFIVPILVSSVLAILYLTLKSHGLHQAFTDAAVISTPNAPKAIISMILYCSYNVMFSIGVLSAFTDKIKSRSILMQSAVIGGLGLFFISFSLNICLLIYAPAAFNFSVPMLYIVQHYDHWVRVFLIAAVWCEIFTTAVSNLFSLASRLCEKKPSLYKLSSLFLVALCIPLSLIDFKWLVSFCYPLFGVLSLFLFIKILAFSCRRRAH